jgi:thioredoxin-like negative regulator of GroEL
MRARWIWLLWALACGGSPSLAPATVAAPVRQTGPIRFIENDYERALAEARVRRLPLFVDAWAPWCHTCLSLRSFVFPDPALRPLAESFVWLSIDTEREENAAAVSKLGVRVLPTLYVVEPTRDKAVVAWPGSLTATELAALLVESAAAVRRGDGEGAAESALLRGHRAGAEGRFADAVLSYREALAAAPADWPGRVHAADGLVTSLADDGQLAACVDAGAAEAPKMPPGTAVADVLRAAIGCAEDLPAATPQRARLEALAALGQRVACDPSQPILADDRSDLYDHVVGALRDLGRGEDAKQLAVGWAAFLERQAAQTPTPAARAVFDAHRVLAYLAVGEPRRALPMLEQSERDFPDDYNPPARLAMTYLALKRNDDAIAAVKRALGKAYGPRKLRLWWLEADAFDAKGDKAAGRETLRAALEFAKTVSLTAGYVKLRDAIEKRLGDGR